MQISNFRVVQCQEYYSLKELINSGAIAQLSSRVQINLNKQTLQQNNSTQSHSMKEKIVQIPQEVIQLWIDHKKNQKKQKNYDKELRILRNLHMLCSTKEILLNELKKKVKNRKYQCRMRKNLVEFMQSEDDEQIQNVEKYKYANFISTKQIKSRKSNFYKRLRPLSIYQEQLNNLILTLPMKVKTLNDMIIYCLKNQIDLEAMSQKIGRSFTHTVYLFDAISKLINIYQIKNKIKKGKILVQCTLQNWAQIYNKLMEQINEKYLFSLIPKQQIILPIRELKEILAKVIDQ